MRDDTLTIPAPIPATDSADVTAPIESKVVIRKKKALAKKLELVTSPANEQLEFSFAITNDPEVLP